MGEGSISAKSSEMLAARKSFVFKALLPLVVGIAIALVPHPSGLTRDAWYFFSLFSAVVVGLILEPIPPAAIGFIGVSLAAAFMMVEPTPAKSVAWALEGFSNSTVWLIFAAFMFALGYEKTGLGRRLGLLLVKALGKNTLGLGYAIALSELILAPFMPSNTARSGGTIFPIIRNIPGLYGSEPGETARKIGSYVMWTALAATCVTSSMFLTALAPNLLALELIKKTVHLEFSWMTWFVGFLPVGIILIAALPLLVYKIYPPEIKSSPEVPKWAGEELNKIGRMSRKEMLMALLALLALLLWIFAQNVVNPTTVALVVISLMIISGIVNWDDILSYKTAWNVLAWFATLVALADGLATVRVYCMAGKRRSDTINRDLSGTDHGLYGDGLFHNPLHVCQHHGAYYCHAACIPCGRSCGSGDERQNAGAVTGLLSRYNGHHHALCNRSISRLLWKRLYRQKGFLDTGAGIWSDLSGRLSGREYSISVHNRFLAQ